VVAQIPGLGWPGACSGRHRGRIARAAIGFGHWQVKCGTCCGVRGRRRSEDIAGGSPPPAGPLVRPPARGGSEPPTWRSESKETNDKTLSVAPRKPLSLKRTVESGHVRQSFSHGRSKSVVVEKRKKRTISTPGDDAHDADHPDQRGGLSSGELDAR